MEVYDLDGLGVGNIIIDLGDNEATQVNQETVIDERDNTPVTVKVEVPVGGHDNQPDTVILHGGQLNVHGDHTAYGDVFRASTEPDKVTVRRDKTTSTDPLTTQNIINFEPTIC